MHFCDILKVYSGVGDNFSKKVVKHGVVLVHFLKMLDFIENT